MGSPGWTRRRPADLPAEVSGFVGRREELERLGRQLRSARVVTVTGPGGVGKTRVALRTAARLAGDFTDGVGLAELAGLHDPDLLPHTVAACLGLPEQDARGQLSAVVSFLRDRRVLLILDTCEHLVDACAALVSVIVRETAGVTVLATSRQALDIPGEHACLIPPLPVPDPGSRAAGAGDAVELFAQRAAAAVPGFAVTEANYADVARLCRRLDGIPLAIELAAVRLRAVPLEQLVGRLEERFALLTGSRRAALPHHQTLRTATEWSYGLCSPDEQLLWARLSVFAGSFDMSAAEEVCDGDPLARDDVAQALIGLVDKSVVLRAGPEAGRYRLLDTIAEFGAEQLARRGEQDRVRGRHVGRYLAMARGFARHAKDDDQLPRFQELRREHANIRAALTYALAEREGAGLEAAWLATALRPYWEISGAHREARHWLNRILDRFPGPIPERAWLLMTRGVVTTLQGDTDDAIADLQDAIAVAQHQGDALARALSCTYLILACTFAGRYGEAERAAATAAEQLRATGDRGGLTSLDIHLGYLYLLTGQLDLCIDRCTQGLRRLGEDSGEHWVRSYLLLITGVALFLQDKHADSGDATRASLELKSQLGDVTGIAYCLEMLATLAARQDRPERTTWLLGAADSLWERAGSRLGGNPFLEELHQQTATTARNALGVDRYTALWQDAARRPLDQVVALATGDESQLSPPAAGHAPSPLTAREGQIAALVAEGLSNREIAGRLVISKRTVDAHVEHILTKLGASSRVQIATWTRADSPRSPGRPASA
jgi:predicted ATPase/DNA-binding CsgD family transcriptional regulator